MSTLRRLSIADWGFRSEETRHLSQLEAISSLNAGDVHDGVEFCAGIRGMIHLQELCLRFSAPSRLINDRIVVSIARLRGLQRLCMIEPNVSIKAFNRIAELPELRCLVLSRHEGVPPQVEPAIVQRLSEMNGLSMIGLYGGWVTDECVSQLKPLKNIRSAQLRSSSLTAAGLRTVFENWQLNSLDLLSTSLTDEMIEMIGSKTMLRYLCIAGCGVSLDQAAKLRRQLALCTVITE